MYLYNIHTHRIVSQDQGYQVKCILNTYPKEFIAQKDDSSSLWYSCGVHPWHSANADLQLELLDKIAANSQVVAIGEAGLDKIKGADIETQIEVFRNQIELAIRVDKPLIIHCVKAWDELISLYKGYKSYIPWIIHGYRGNIEQTKQLSSLGFKFSIGERFNNEALKHIPLGSIFCETDISENDICHIYQAVSACLDIDFNHFVEIVSENMSKNFK